MANARTPSSNLTNDPNSQGYPSRRTLEQPRDAAEPYVQPPQPGVAAPFVPQLESPAPPRPATPGPEASHFYAGSIPGEDQHAHGERDRMSGG
jgi:hypothetical protein